MESGKLLPEAEVPSSIGPQTVSKFRNAPGYKMGTCIRTPTAAQLAAEDKALREEKKRFMSSTDNSVAAVSMMSLGSTLGSQVSSVRPSSPDFSLGSAERFPGTTLVPRGLMGRDSRPSTEFTGTLPGSMDRQPLSTKRSARAHAFDSTSRLYPGGPALTPIKCGRRALLQKPFEVSRQLYDPDAIAKAAEAKRLNAANPSESFGVTMSSMGKQIKSRHRSQPNTIIGSTPLQGFKVTSTGAGPYNVDRGLAATKPRALTASLDLMSRPAKPSNPLVDWDYLPPPGPDYDATTAFRKTRPQVTSFSMGSPPDKKKQRDMRNFLRF